MRDLLTARYESLRVALTRQLGSEELARESLHETWLRLHRQEALGPVERPTAFLLRVAANVARDRRRAERRRARQADVEAVLTLADPAPGPAQQAQSRIDLERAEQAIRRLPPRTRAILIASRLHGQPHQAIADRLGISRRTVLYELKSAIRRLEESLAGGAEGDCVADADESS